jgi:phenylpropionate dioxygenase-like ring-hydroxylating dioxygenase large terminal subunit
MNVAKTSGDAGYSIQTIDDLTASQNASIRAIPAHDKAISPVIEARRPASIFLDRARYDLEQRQVFRRLPMPITLSRALPDPDSVLPHDGYGIPLLLTRDRQGKVHVLLNACGHKGARLLDGGGDAQRAGKITCRYHAWAYALDGKCLAVPREETFAGFDKSTRGLVELPSHEAGGLIWCVLDRRAKPDFSSIHPQIVADFDAFDLGEQFIFDRKTFDVKANWKLILEPFLEGYHVRRLHVNSVGPMFSDSPNVIDRFGDHLRQISGKQRFTPDVIDIPGENIHKSVTHAYQIFPHTVLVTSPYYISVKFIMPIAPDRSTVEYFMLTRSPADNDKARDLYQRSYDMIINVFGNEDFRAAEWCQEGLSSGALDDVVYCGMEAAVPDYYANLERRLEGE